MNIALLFAVALNATELVDAVVKAGGGERWSRVNLIRFTVNITEGDRLVLTAVHDWHVRAGYDVVEWNGRRFACSVPERSRNEFAQAAYRRWINDSPSVVALLRFEDTRAEVTYQGQHDGLEVLRASFASDSFLSGGQYEFYIDPASHLARRLNYRPSSGQSVSATSDNYRNFGGLLLATEHVSGDMRVTITNIRIVWDHPGLFEKIPVQVQFLILFLCIVAWVLVWGFLMPSGHPHVPGEHGAPRGNSLEAIRRYWSWRGPP